MKLSEHFEAYEFICKCGCGKSVTDKDLVTKLEKLRELLGEPIYVTSGYRCPNHSVSVGGYATDAHTVGIAADIQVPNYSVEDIAEAAEKAGFTGIGLMDNAVHVDVRNTNNYSNAHWFGDERTGKNVETFIRNKLKETFILNVGGKKYKMILEEI